MTQPMYLKNRLKSIEDVKHLIQLMCPQWNSESINIEPINGGRTSNIFRCCHKDDTQEAITVRSRNAMSDFTINNMTLEIEVLKKLNTLGHFPKLLSIFENGYCYQYVEGECLFNLQDFYELKNPLLKLSVEQLSLLAKRLAAIHSIKTNILDYTQTRYFENLHRILQNWYPRNMDGVPTFEEMKLEVNFLTQQAKKLQSPFVLCHGDAHVGNIVWDENKELMLLMDWEMMHIGYQAYDIATFFFLLDYEDEKYGFTKCLPHNYNETFLQYYVKHLKENSENISLCANAEQLKEQIFFFKMVLNVYFPILLGSMRAQQSIKATHTGFSIPIFMTGMFKEYQQLKKCYQCTTIKF